MVVFILFILVLYIIWKIFFEKSGKEQANSSVEKANENAIQRSIKPELTSIKPRYPDRMFRKIDLPKELLNRELIISANIYYIKRDGEESHREIDVHRLHSFDLNDCAIEAFCKFRMAKRTFMFSRIKSITNIESGEIFSDPSFFFQEYFNGTPEGKVLKVIKRMEPEIILLLMLSKADGALRKNEIEIICKYLLLDNYLNENYTDLLKDKIRFYDFHTKNFPEQIRLLASKDGFEKVPFSKAVKEIVSVDKKPHPQKELVQKAILEKLKN